MRLEPGTMVTSNVRLRCPLGQGGMGHVWLAEHLGLRVDVAVKFIADKLALDDPAVRARFEQEASTAARIKSDHVVQTHDCGIMADGTPYIVMELLEGESLQARLDRDAVLGLADTGRVVLHVSKALGRAHRLGFVHRDIKPANLFLCQTDEGLHVKVLDFGVAQPTQPPGQDGRPAAPAPQPPIAASATAAMNETAMFGTLPFLSPELFSGQGPTDHHADLWALAVVAYRCLAGAFPFNGHTAGLLCLSVMTGEFLPATTLRPGLPPQIDGWLATAFHRDRAARFQSARDMAIGLARAVPGMLGEIEDEGGTLSGMYPQIGRPAARSSPTAALDTASPAVLRPAMAERLRHQGRLVAIVGGAATILLVGAALLVVLATPKSSEDARPGTQTNETTGQAPSAATDATASEPSDGGAEAQRDAGAAGGLAAASGSTPAPSAVVPNAGGTAPRPGKGKVGKREDYGF